MVPDNSSVTVRYNGRYFELKGEDVIEILIPALKYLRDGISVDEIGSIIKVDDMTRLVKVFESLQNRGWIQSVSKDEKGFGEFIRNYSTIGISQENINDALSGKSITVLDMSDSCDAFKEMESRLDNVISVDIVDVYNDNDADIENVVLKSDFVVISIGESDTFNLKRLNNILYKNKKPFILYESSGFIADIGPMVVPPYTACLECYIDRRNSNLDFYEQHITVEKFLDESNYTKSGYAYSVDPLTKNIGISILFEQIVQYFLKDITWNFPKCIEAIIEIDMYNITFAYSDYLKKPKCKICGVSPKESVPNKFWVKPLKYQGQ